MEGAGGRGLATVASPALAPHMTAGKEEEEETSPSQTPSPPAPSQGPFSASVPEGTPASDDMRAVPPPGMPLGMMNNTGMAMGTAGYDFSSAGKKRGRPRKYGVAMSLALTPFSPPSSDDAKRTRGRPPGSGRRQLLSTLGELLALSAGGHFKPHVVTIAAGEDVAARILSFSKKGPRAVCILSANGSISNVTLRQPGSSGGTLTYEGRFEILSLSGSFTITDDGGIRSRTGGISVSLAGPDGRVVGGGVTGLLLAASPIQVVVGSFLPNYLKEFRRKANLEPYSTPSIPVNSGLPTAVRPISQANPDEGCETLPTSTMVVLPTGGDVSTNNMNHGLNSSCVPFLREGWQGVESSTEHKFSPDINISLPGE